MKEEMVERNGGKKRWKEMVERDVGKKWRKEMAERNDGKRWWKEMEELMNKWKKRMQDTKPCRCIRFN